ncbi:cell adhesion molecule DSCAM-like [Biomphalaria glabrata]|uniref:Cell adhesion molecule DSCAM-like n=1 Tax=Biomphalaria glabrata TaxID=6526 RepID=A0A9W3BMM3_BIOGL|nr:cell adhesion molecule DSCAM-like [Biomphalaria glabrata]
MFYLLTSLIIAICPAVDGATCVTKPTCEQTSFTLSTCISGTCSCLNTSYVPVRSGCAFKMDKPVITSGQGRSNEVLLGERLTLTCFVDGAESFEWYLDDKLLNGFNEMSYNEEASASNVGSFTCRGIGSKGDLKSDRSDAFNVVLLGTGEQAQSTESPKITVPTTAVFSGSSITLSCDNIPMGYPEGLITYTVDDKYLSYSRVTIDESTAGKNVACNLTSPHLGVTFSYPTSAVGKLPSIVDRIQYVTVTGNGNYLVCSTTPKIDYGQASHTYAWFADGQVLLGQTSSSYSPDSQGTSISCSVQLSGQRAVSSINKIISIGRAVISTNIRKPLVSQRVILTCAGVNSGTVTYRWEKDSKPIPRQFDRKLQLDNIQKEESGYYSCYANKDNYYSYSSLYIGVSDSITKPIINVIGEFGTVNRLGENGNYWLACYSESASDGMTYEWTVNGIKSSVTDKFYSLPSVSSSDNGDYVCKAKYKSLTSDDSDPKTLTVTAPGILCYEDSFCLFPYGGYTGKCDETERCECSDGYSKRGNLCSEASVTVISSTVLIAVGVLYSRFVDL